MSNETITKSNCKIIPVSLKDANKFVEAFHRHCKPVICHKFSLGLLYKEKIIGVIIVGRPVARALDNGLNVEINRCCVLEGYKNANSFLYALAKRIWTAIHPKICKRLLGRYERNKIITRLGLREKNLLGGY